MSGLQLLPGGSQAADEAVQRLSPGSEMRLKPADLTQEIEAAARPISVDPGVQASFSPQSIQVLADSAQGIANETRAGVQQIGQTGVDMLDAAADAIDAAGAQAADAINAGAAALVKGVDVARAGVGALASAAGDALSDATDRLGEAAQTTAGYVALAALAGGALLNEFA